MGLFSGIASALDPVKDIEKAVGAVGSLASGNPMGALESLMGGGADGSNPLSMIESLFGGGDSIGSGSGQDGSQDSSTGGASSLMSVVSLAAMFL